MRTFLLILGLVTMPAFFIACQNGSDAPVAMANPAAVSPPPAAVPTPPAKDATADAPRISLADAKKAFDSGTAVFIDTRAAEAYREEHVKGAINITLQDDASKYNTIPKGKKIIVYCS